MDDGRYLKHRVYAQLGIRRKLLPLGNFYASTKWEVCPSVSKSVQKILYVQLLLVYWKEFVQTLKKIPGIT